MVKLVEIAFESALTGAVGSFFAPASATAAGGVLNVMGACAIGGTITAIPATIIVTLTAVALTNNLTSRNYPLTGVLATLFAAEIIGTVIVAAKIGAYCMGVAANPVLVCAVLGAVAVLAASVLFFGLVASGSGSVVNNAIRHNGYSFG